MDSSISNTQILLFVTVLYLLLLVGYYVNRYMTITRHDIAVTSLNDLDPADHIFLRLPFTWHRPTELTRHALYLGQLPLENRPHPVRAIADFGVLNSKHPVIRPLEDFLQLARPPNASPDPAPGDPLSADRLTVPLFKRTYYNKRHDSFILQPETLITFARRFAATRQYRPYNALYNNGELYISLLKTGPFSQPAAAEMVNFLVGCLAVLTIALLLVLWIRLLTGVAAIGLVVLLAPVGLLLILLTLTTLSGRAADRRLQKLLVDIFTELAKPQAEDDATSGDPTVAINPDDRHRLSKVVKGKIRRKQRREEAVLEQETAT